MPQTNRRGSLVVTSREIAVTGFSAEDTETIINAAYYLQISQQREAERKRFWRMALTALPSMFFLFLLALTLVSAASYDRSQVQRPVIYVE